MTNPNESNTSSIESVVMRRVYSMRLIQSFLAPVTFSIALLLLAVWGIGREVWVAHVIQNMPTFSPAHFAEFIRFYEAAFLNTRMAVQLLVLSVFTAVLSLAYNFVQVVRHTVRFS